MEADKLLEVILFKPHKNIDIKKNTDNLLLHDINTAKLAKEIDAIAKIYNSHGIKVNFINVHHCNNDKLTVFEKSLINMIYVRDLFFMTPYGAIIAKMCKNTRKSETVYVKNLLTKLDINIIDILDDTVTFEGADAIWLNSNTVLVGIGKRTNEKGLLQLQEFLVTKGVKVEKCCIRTDIPQHLLGTVQIVSNNLALVRTEIADPNLVNILQKYGYRILQFKENHEITHQQAMNLVAIAPNKVIISQNCTETQKLLAKNSIDTVDTVKIDEIIKGGGGLACCTAILTRVWQN